jgi:hypothetical protein
LVGLKKLAFKQVKPICRSFLPDQTGNFNPRVSAGMNSLLSLEISLRGFRAASGKAESS